MLEGFDSLWTALFPRLPFAKYVAEFTTEAISASACYHYSNIPLFHYSMIDYSVFR